MQELSNLLLLVSLLVAVPCFVYGLKNPHRKGEPLGKEHKLLWTSLLLSAGFLVAALVVSFASP